MFIKKDSDSSKKIYIQIFHYRNVDCFQKINFQKGETKIYKILYIKVYKVLFYAVAQLSNKRLFQKAELKMFFKDFSIMKVL